MNTTEKSLADNLLKFLGRSTLRGLLRCFAGAAVCGSLVSPVDTLSAIDAGIPPITWWRKEARAGVAAAEVFANGGTPPALKPLQ